MFKGFYMATSGMLSQSRIMNTISNNMSNASTPGYKKDVLATSTFREEMVNRTGNLDKTTNNQIGKSSMIRTAQELVTNYKEGILEFSERPLDFAIMGKGFFEVRTANGESRYTRNGSFNLDKEGYLCLQHVGRVVGENGEIFLGTDDIKVTKDGIIKDAKTNEELGTIRISNIADYKQLQKAEEGMFKSNAPLNATPSDSTISQGTIERSNVEASEEMVSMLASQRAFQSSSQIAKAYDQMMAKATEIGTL